jgi:FkbM family methyltransferase
VTFISYAQNYEDLRLWRALGNLDRGCYLDIGAQHPVLDSVSKAFYELGWRGAHVEPTSAYAAALREDRPDEPVFELAVGRPGTMAFYEFPETGLSTGIAEIARMHSATGFAVRLQEVPVIPLSTLFANFGAETVHWMKIDVEGMEADVVGSWDQSPIKPWVLVIESVHPATREPTEHDWLDVVLRRGYREVAFDGLSRYFVSEEHGDLAQAVAAPPNIFDDFTITRQHFSARGVVAEYAPAVAELEASLAHAKEETNAVHRRVQELESAIAALTAERERVGSELLAERTRAADLAAEFERERNAFTTELNAERTKLETQLASERGAAHGLAVELERARESFATLIANERTELEHRVSALVDQAAATEEGHQRIVAELKEGISETQINMAAKQLELDRALAKSEVHRSALLQADALIRQAVQSRRSRWRQVGEAIGLVRPQPVWRILSNWSLPVN